ncbi:MAG: T9SS type A sorting domain-containing protein [Saprospiraceae bacterium]|nr:T9SS type A sorting domain-containing protein [Saprospiraceae bacterium]
MKNKFLFFNSRWERNLILTFIFGISILDMYAQDCANETLGQVFNQTSGTRSGCVDVTGYGASYVIPVAVHVLKDNHGDGNWPPDNIVQDMLDNANTYLAPHFMLVPISDPNNCGAIAFRPTAIRHSISGEVNSQLDVKDLSRVDPSVVCNIWLVRDVINGDGFAYNPRGSGINAALDGIVVDKDSLYTTTLAHEVGHYLGLHHVWGPDEGNSTNCYAPADACSYGDEVADTPRSFRRFPFPNSDCSYSNLETMPEVNRFFCVHGEPIPCDNIMGYSSGRNVLTQGQRDLMISTINLYRPSLGAYSNACLTCTDPCVPCYYGTPPVDPSTNPNYDFCSPCHAAHVHLDMTSITGMINITQPTLITQDLNVHGTLNVNSDLYVAPGKTIYINQGGKIVVGNLGHITSCSGLWNGIYAYRGTIDIKEGGTISKANLGVYSLEGRLNCDWAFFYDNGDDVQLQGNAQASFANSAFIGSRNAVQLYGLPNLTNFSGCDFAYQSGSAILTNYGSTISVAHNNIFTNCVYAISLGNVFGTASNNFIGNSETGNQFTNCYNGIRSVNASSLIRNNNFDNTSFGLVMRGLNGFTSQSNSYSGSSYAEAIDGTGTDSNQSFGNDYSSTEGIYPHNYNAGYNFYNNCFNTLWWDVNALGVINSTQFGPGDRAAGNCFTHGGVTDFICETSTPVAYGIPNTVAAPDCLFPDNTGGWNYTTFPSSFVTTGECGANFTSENQYGYLIRMGCDEKKLKKSTDSLRLIVKTLKTKKENGPLTKAEQILLAKTERHLRFAIAQWAWCLRKEGRRRELKEWYKEWSKEFPNDKYLALKMAEVTADMGQYTQSKAELDSIALLHPIASEILQSLKMSIDVLQATAQRNLAISEGNTIVSEIPSSESKIDGRFISGYQLSPANHELLRRVAHRIEPEAAYGRALLSYLTGEMIDPPSLMPVGNRSKSIGSVAAGLGEIYKMNPNPAAQDVIIEIQHQERDKQYHYTLNSITGNIIDQGPINGLANLNVSVIPNGVYIVRITKDNLTVDIKKLIIQK